MTHKVRRKKKEDEEDEEEEDEDVVEVIKSCAVQYSTLPLRY